MISRSSILTALLAFGALGTGTAYGQSMQEIASMFVVVEQIDADGKQCGLSQEA